MYRQQDCFNKQYSNKIPTSNWLTWGIYFQLIQPIQVITSFHTLQSSRILICLKKLRIRKFSTWAVEHISTEWITFTFSFFVVLNWMLLKVSLKSLIYCKINIVTIISFIRYRLTHFQEQITARDIQFSFNTSLFC